MGNGLELRKRERSVGQYLTVMIVGQLVCGIFCGIFVGVSYSVDSFGGALALQMLGYAFLLPPVIYHFYVMWHAVEDYNLICRRRTEDYFLSSPNYLVVFLLGNVTLGIYKFYWFYRYGENLKRLGGERQVPIETKGSTYLCMVLIPAVVSDVLFLITMIFCLSVIDAAVSRFDISGMAGSGIGMIICMFLFLIAAVCSSVMEYLAWGKWLGNLNHLTRREYLAQPDQSWGVRKEGEIAILTGHYMGAELPVREGEEILLGRDESRCHLIFLNEKVSRVHCGIRYVEATDSYLVTDYSMNGTYRDGGIPLQKGCPTVCSPGTVITLGKSGEGFRLERSKEIGYEKYYNSHEGQYEKYYR